MILTSRRRSRFVRALGDVDGSVDKALDNLWLGRTRTRTDNFIFEFEGSATIDFFTYTREEVQDDGTVRYYLNAVHFSGQSGKNMMFQLGCDGEQPTIADMVNMMEQTTVTVVPSRP